MLYPNFVGAAWSRYRRSGTRLPSILLLQAKTAGNTRTYKSRPPAAGGSSGECRHQKESAVGQTTTNALLRWNQKESRFQILLLSGKVARDAVAEGEAFQRKRIRQGTRKAIVPSIYIGKKRAQWGQQWERNWSAWTL